MCFLNLFEEAVVIYISDIYSKARTLWQLFYAFISGSKIDIDICFNLRFYVLIKS